MTPPIPGINVACNMLTCFFRNKGPFTPDRVSGNMEPMMTRLKVNMNVRRVVIYGNAEHNMGI